MKALQIAALCLLCAAPVAADPTDFGPGTKIGRVSGLPDLPREMARIYRDFRRDVRYFGAMAVNFDTRMAVYLHNYHDATRVQIAALEGCRILSLNKKGCVIYAVAMPQSLPIDRFDASGLSAQAAESFKTAYVETRLPGTYAAFAISGIGHYGYGSAYQTQSDARDTALAYCERGVAAFGPDARRFARARGWQKCRVIDVAFTPQDG